MFLVMLLWRIWNLINWQRHQLKEKFISLVSDIAQTASILPCGIYNDNKEGTMLYARFTYM